MNIGSTNPIARKNDIMTALVEPIAMQAIHQIESTNPLFEVFEREPVENSAEIEEIVLGDANIEAYDATGATVDTPRNVQAVARYYNDYTHKVYTTTIYRNEIRKVALNPEKAPELASKILANLTATRDDDVYSIEKQVLVDMKTTYPFLKADTIASGTAEEQGEALTLAIRNTIDALIFKNYDYIPWNNNHPTNKIKGRAYLDRIRIVIPYKIKNKLNVGYLANVYNLEKTELLSKIVTIDTDDGIVYVLDKLAVFRYPQTDELLGRDNEEAGCRNEFLHVNQMFGASTLFKFAFIDASAMYPTTTTTTTTNG